MLRYPGDRGLGYTVAAIERIEVAADKEGDKPSERYTITVSSEYEMARADWDGVWREVLDHGPGAIELDWFKSGAAPFLADHDRHDQIGALSNPRVEDRKLKVDLRWASTTRAQEIKSMVDEGVRPSVSVGWAPKKAERVERNKDKGDLWRVTRWEPKEVSSVSIPANPTVGFGRAEGETALAVEATETETTTTSEKRSEKKMKKVKGERGSVIEVAEDDERPALSEYEIASHTHAEVVRLCEAHGVSGLTEEFIRRGLTPEAVALEILNRKRGGGSPALSTTAKASADPLAALGKKERTRYSYARALSIAAGQIDGTERIDGLEAEVDQELRTSQAGFAKYQKFERGVASILLPMDLRTDDQKQADYEIRARHQATLSTTVATKGAELVFETPGQLIELLRNQSAAITLGAQTLTGLTGPIGFPKKTGAMTTFWVGEVPGAEVTASDIALGMVQLAPKTLQATTAYSRQLLAQGTPDVDAMVRRELATIHGLAIDRAVFHGLGAAGEPLGIYLAPDVTFVDTGAAVDYTELTRMIGQVADANAAMGTLGWVTTPLMAAKWLATLDFSAAAAGLAIWQGTIETGGSGRVAGYRAFSTNQISKLMNGSAPTGGTSHGIIFGNWAEAVIGFFGALEIIIDPYALKKRGIIEVTSFQMADVAIKHGQSFCKSLNSGLS